MQIGVTMFTTDLSIAAAELAREAEARGFHSLYMPEHTHIPTSRKTPAPTGAATLPEEYKRTLDPFVALGAAAAVTTRLRIGTGICLVAQRDPVVTAKAVATLDHLSDGRFVFGVGYGWNREEMHTHGVAFEHRRARVREHMLAMQRIWDADEASFHGEYVHFDPLWSWPKPLQRPRPPILVGGAAGPKLFEHIAEWGDGWIPIGGAGVADALVDLRAAFERRGRDPATLQVVPYGTVPERSKLDYYASIGVTEVVLRIESGPRDAVLPQLDRYAALVE